jgi:poly-gamma-glutamate capsule biosynthesis protein CapA/YwtB (metallophosphatase superfamily)
MDVKAGSGDSVTLFLCGDVMTGRGIDQILPHPSPPRLNEPNVSSAYEYVELAQRAHGEIVGPVDFSYIWGDVLHELERHRPAARIVNLETAVTAFDSACSGKAIHYRMNPRNVQCLKSAGFDCCVLANNHAMDYGREGLQETLQVLREAGLQTAGAGMDFAASRAPARLRVSETCGILVFSCGTPDSGISCEWEATEYRPGLCVLDDLSVHAVEEIAALVASHKRSGDIVVMSLHWGANWGYDVDEQQRRFAHLLIDRAGVDIVHGHSSHHPKPIEVYRGKLILYGCGDLLNDYEGLAGYGRYRPELGLMYFPEINAATGELLRLTMTPTRVRRLRANLATPDEGRWLCAALNGECARFGASVQMLADNTLDLRWQQSAIRASA